MDETTIDLHSVLGLLRRQLRLIIVTVVVISAVAGFIIYSLTPVYTSSALIMVDPSRKNLLQAEAMTSPLSDNARIDSEVEILKSDNILLRVIEAENLMSDAGVGVSLSLRQRVLAFLRIEEPTLPTASDLLTQTLNRMRSALQVSRRGSTYLISVGYRSEDPERASYLANAITKAYISAQLESKVNQTLASRDVLQSRLEQARTTMVATEGQFDSFIDSNLTRIATESGRNDLQATQNQIAQLNALSQNRAQEMTAATYALAQSDWQTVVASLESDALTELNQRRAELADRISGAAPESQVSIDLQSELNSIENQMRNSANSQLAVLQQGVQNDTTRVETLRTDLRNQVLSSSLSPDILAELYDLRQGAQLARDQYSTLLSRTQELQTQADLQIADSRVVSEALPPRNPSFPNRTSLLAFSAIGALAVGIALAFLYENFVGGFTSASQLQSVLRTKVAAAISRQKISADKTSLADMVVTAPMSEFAESLRRLRATLTQLLQTSATGRDNSVIMVTSTAPAEGKTTIALALARSYALAGTKVLLIDCDLRQPSVHKHVGHVASAGLNEYLASEDLIEISGFTVSDEVSPATIILGSRRSNVPTDQLLTNKRFNRLLAAAKSSFEVVILDTPPLGPVVDGLYIAPQVDAIVFVTRWASTSQQDAKQVLNSLTEVKRPETPVVAVLNHQDSSRMMDRQKYGSYYQDAS